MLDTTNAAALIAGATREGSSPMLKVLVLRGCLIGGQHRNPGEVVDHDDPTELIANGKVRAATEQEIAQAAPPAEDPAPVETQA